MIDLTDRLGRLTVFTENTEKTAPLDVIANEVTEKNRERFTAKGFVLMTDIQPNVTVKGDANALRDMISELLENAYRYAKSTVSLTLTCEGERVTLLTENDTDLAEGSYEQAFDRFVSLHGESGGTGLGLARVRDTVRTMDGRAYAEVRNGKFILKAEL